MKLKLKLLAAALALAAGVGSANAAIQNAATPSLNSQSEGVFTAYGNGFAYTFDLAQAGFNSLFGSNTLMNNLVSNNIATLNGSATVGVLQQPAGGIIFDYALPNFNSFLASAGSSGIQFTMAFGTSVGTDRWLTTLQSPTGSMGLFGSFDNIGAAFNSYTGAVNGKMTANGSATSATSTDGWAITTAADGAAYGALYGNNWGAVAGMDSTAMLGEAVRMAVLYGSTSILPIGKAFTMNGAPIEAQTYLSTADNQWHLRIAAVPEPESYAMLLAGLLMVGAMVRRRVG